MMKELMLRLIKDGTIAGYLWIVEGIIAIGHSPDSEAWRTYDKDHHGCSKQWQFDSFDMGIKVGDEWDKGTMKMEGGTWWFVGDKFLYHLKYTNKDHSESDIIGILAVSYNIGWYFKVHFGDEEKIWGLDNSRLHIWKRIGNIYEEE